MWAYQKVIERHLISRIDKLTCKEIVAQLDINHTAVEKKTAKALTKMQNLIKKVENFKI